ncbi:hypothetical protein niasHT_031041 [Heterodera trifolii]|uniref:Uncharacterized protein n=1 Tax=Heterodera trifolii TaxID=157864 RepID=A0ABD2I3T3_9BILA
MPSCGNKYYDHVKHCAMVHFYDNNPDKEPEENPPDTRRNKIINQLLIMNIPCPILSYFRHSRLFRRVHHWGKQKLIQIFASADGNGTIGASPFTFPAEFKNKICWDLIQSHTPIYFQDIMITLSGECFGTRTFYLPALDALSGRVQEMRRLQLDLRSGEAVQWSSLFDDYHFTHESKELHWQPTDLGTIDEYGTPNEDLGYTLIKEMPSAASAQSADDE